jgi:hypothetical protein
MKKIIAALLVAFVLVLPVQATQVTTTTSSVTISGQTITYNVASAQTPGYYRLAYDSTSKKIGMLIFSKGTTKSIYTLYCVTTYAEVQAFVTAQGLTGTLPADPTAGH